MTGIILQVRLDSTRLPQKALLALSGEPVIVRVMETLSQIPADAYVLACDTDSESVFQPLAESCGFLCISGPKEDVLERFCRVIRKTGISTVLRATGDNPFLFYDAAIASLERFSALQSAPRPADYFTWAGLPHGSGIEVFSSRRLLEAAALSDLPHEHEHVGPALYNHPERFHCVRETAPSQWYHPEIRTTIDTREDYERAVLMAEYLQRTGTGTSARSSSPFPPASEKVIEAWTYVSRPILFVPSVDPSRGTGHFRRAVSLIRSMRDAWRCLLYLPRGSELCSSVPADMKSCAISELPASCHLAVVDYFRSDESFIRKLRECGPVVSFDDGGAGRGECDYLVDIIPSLTAGKTKPNLSDVSYLPLPKTRKKEETDGIKTALVLSGGGDPSPYVFSVAALLSSFDIDVTAIDSRARGTRKTSEGYTISGLVENLRESLCHFDLVVTHYGFTAFEALAAGCRVILFSPTAYHYRLAKAYRFAAIPPHFPFIRSIVHYLEKGIPVPSVITPKTVQSDLSDLLGLLANRTVLPCPLCGEHRSRSVIVRRNDRTVCSCAACGMLYPSFIVGSGREYGGAYFFEEYRTQYGRTYLEDFEAIRSQGQRRMKIISSVSEGSTLLDIGCAYGPFLVAARDAGWDSVGTDISPEAVSYVRERLALPACVSAFPAPDLQGFLTGKRFDAVTLWFVIEHFMDLESVFERIRELLVPGGILAFSTPSASGISARKNRASFLAKSPRDHFSIWTPRLAKAHLKRYGFQVVKIVSTGHHPERFPFMGTAAEGSPRWRAASALSRLFKLGDTFEVYAMKNGVVEDWS